MNRLASAFLAVVFIFMVSGGASDKDKCRFIFYNLFELISLEQTRAVLIVIEWDDTVRCDKFHNLTDVRLKLANRITEPSMTRIRSYQPNEMDEMKAERALVHYKTWQQNRLEHALWIRDWLFYHIFVRAQRALAVVGFVACGFWLVVERHTFIPWHISR